MSELIDINKVITCLDFAIDAINHECYNDALSSINEAKEAYNTLNEWVSDERIAAINRISVIAVKHCPRDHHDWKELLSLLKLIGPSPKGE